jgi:hypothetical protein
MKHLAVCLVTLAACAPNPDGSYGSPGDIYWFDSASPDVINAHYRTVCEGYGFDAGTPDMARCVQEEVLKGRREAQRDYDRTIRNLEDSTAEANAERDAFMNRQ